MENYFMSMRLLGLYDQNLPVFKDARAKRLASIEKMNKLVTIMPRLMPKVPTGVFILNKNDPEWDDKMIYPIVRYNGLIYQFSYWLFFTGIYCYNWNVLHANKRLRHVKNLYPLISGAFLYHMLFDYNSQLYKVQLFENYCKVRAQELFNENKYMLKHEHFKQLIYFQEDMKDTLNRIHRQANNHNSEDFKDSELIVQDFIRRYSDPENPEAALFRPDGRVKILN
jgi:hypothetical protein